MKTMSCNQLGGPESCNHKFHAETFEEMAEMSKKHGMEMFQKGEKEHIEAMEKMSKLMKNPKEIKKWLNKKKEEFEKS